MTPDIERAARAICRLRCSAGRCATGCRAPIGGLSERIKEAAAALETLAVSEAFVEAAAKRGLAEFCQPTIAVAWSELQPAAKAKWTKIARAALRAGLDAVLGRKPQ